MIWCGGVAIEAPPAQRRREDMERLRFGGTGEVAGIQEVKV